MTGLDVALPMNSGAEAVETAIKAARRWGHRVKGLRRPEIVVAEGNFHGRTTTIISFSSEPEYRDGFPDVFSTVKPRAASDSVVRASGIGGSSADTGASGCADSRFMKFTMASSPQT